ncbi:hypothetical protein CRV15_30905 (plasmid) [Streptomyces clavuligerus]|nr:hypothetical protein SSCG_02743 [Streptomyces clavuligerus]QCS09994.1 hypothetical protein CRV15_30905 [Streptomyces clavuligerus]QPJ97962.1 hypothetical protein GE265_33540 [Streptomyces clavuligerus]
MVGGIVSVVARHVLGSLNATNVAGPRQKIRVMAGNLAYAPQPRSGQSLGPDAEVVGDMAGIGRGIPGQFRMPLVTPAPFQQSRVPRR